MLKINDINYFSFEIIGEFTAKEKWIHSKRSMFSYELIFVLDGTVFIEEEGVMYEVTENQMLILEPDKVHFGYQESFPASFYWLHFYTDMPLPFKYYSGSSYSEIKRMLKKLMDGVKSNMYTKNAADAYALMIFYEMHSCMNDRKTVSLLSEKVREYICRENNKSITLASIAEHFNYSKGYISKLFLKDFGIGIKDFIISERLESAKDLLLTSNYSLKEISFMLGYDNENLFAKFFKYHENMSPGQFRLQYFRRH